MTVIQRLRELYVLDQEWDEKRPLFQSVRQRLADQSELEARREAQRRRTTDLGALQSRLRDNELELAGVQQKAHEVETSLYGGRVGSPRELENLQRDSELLHKHIAQLEEAILVTMTEIDDLEKAVGLGTQELKAFEAAWAKQQETLTAQYRTLHERLTALRDRRDKIRATLARAELILYDELRATKAGVALAPMKQGICQICRVTSPNSKVEAVATGEVVITCEGCGRILYQA